MELSAVSYALAKIAEEKVFRDPVHGYVHVKDQVIVDLIETKEFQRLRRIKQLGTTSTTFHGAEHSRFNHSLGVYELTRRIIDEIFAGRSEWDESERLLSLCAGLLHDLGHGPYSHSFEKVFDLDHEEFTRKIILGSTEVNAVLKKVEVDFPEKVASVIEKTYKNPLVISLISSQIDADRMDYLLRDAHYTGVSYGKFDIERILRVIRPTKKGMVVKASGMHVVEDYIMSRYQMYRQIYFHPVSNSAEVLLTKIFQRVKVLFETGYQFKLSPAHFESIFKKKVSVDDYIKLDESIVQYYFQLWLKEEDTILSDLCERFLNRHLFKSVEFHDSDEDFKKLERLTTLFHKVGIDPDYYLTVHTSSNIGYESHALGTQQITLLLKNGEYADLSDHSTIVSAINGKKSVYKYLYYPKDKIISLTEEQPYKKEIVELLGLK
ncbi:MAG: hypothetical protein K0R71_2064 [Bacillales bacterium]|jgi:HD superfamily phosphohydrolase|nr:hypothetical protein [Bacillales bacterium]